MADIKDSYILTLEKKMAELCGIDLCEIRKNQVANALDEAKSIVQMASYVEGISVQKQGAVQSATANPNIDLVYKLIERELGENRGSHALPPLKYGYSALEPHISGAIMEIHHTKHHNGYITNLINATKKLVEAEGANDVKSQNDLFTAINFNGGGHLNHTIFWTNMSPNGGGAPSGPIADAINKDFGSFEAFKEKFSSVSVAVKGSGWGWLGFCPTSKKLQVASCQNQDPLQVTHGLIPLLGLDVWEHAYYLQYKNLRAEYVKAFFNVINWENVNERYVKAQSAAQL